MAVEVTRNVRIDERELVYTFQRSQGPGGQHVNKTSTRVTLTFDVVNSSSLTARHKATLQARLASRLSHSGVLRLVSGRFRTQSANRRAVRLRFVTLLSEALRPVKPRRKTRVTAATKARRLEEKRRHGQRKRERSRSTDE